MSTHQIHIFISHSWKYTGHYETLADWIFHTNWRFGQAAIDFRNYSVPRDSPIHDAPNTTALKEAIYARIARSHVVVIPTGMYTNYSTWIQNEIKGAKFYGKPILAVNPWAQERKSSVVIQNSDDLTGWNRDPLVKKIWDLHRR